MPSEPGTEHGGGSPVKSGGRGCQAKETARTKAPRKDHQKARVAENTEEGWGGRGGRMRGHYQEGLISYWQECSFYTKCDGKNLN